MHNNNNNDADSVKIIPVYTKMVGTVNKLRYSYNITLYTKLNY